MSSGGNITQTYKVFQKNLSIENPRDIIRKNKITIHYFILLTKDEIVKNEKDDLNIIIRKLLFNIQLNKKQDFSNNKIITKDDIKIRFI